MKRKPAKRQWWCTIQQRRKKEKNKESRYGISEKTVEQIERLCYSVHEAFEVFTAVFVSFKRFRESDGVHSPEDVIFELQQIDCSMEEFFAEIGSNREVDGIRESLLTLLQHN